MPHLDLVALIVEDYDTAIDFFVRVLQFDLIEDSALDHHSRSLRATL